MLEINCRNIDETMKLGRRLSQIATDGRVRALLMRGNLGSGKTTLTRAFVEALPDGDSAEISSPSFTVCNIYPTEPQVVHCDLYRSRDHIPDDVLDALEDPDVFTIIEWAEFLPETDRPQEYLDIAIQSCDTYHTFVLHAHGAAAEDFLRGLQQGIRENP